MHLCAPVPCFMLNSSALSCCLQDVRMNFTGTRFPTTCKNGIPRLAGTAEYVSYGLRDPYNASTDTRAQTNSGKQTMCSEHGRVTQCSCLLNNNGLGVPLAGQAHSGPTGMFLEHLLKCLEPSEAVVCCAAACRCLLHKEFCHCSKRPCWWG